MRFVEHLFAIINRNTILGLLLLNSCQWDSEMLPSRHERTYERLISVYSHFMYDWRVYFKFLMNDCILDSFIFKEIFAVTYIWSKICFVYSKIWQLLFDKTRYSSNIKKKIKVIVKVCVHIIEYSAKIKTLAFIFLSPT